jgi:hypothetical protein
VGEGKRETGKKLVSFGTSPFAGQVDTMKVVLSRLFPAQDDVDWGDVRRR